MDSDMKNITAHFFELVDSEWMQKLQDEDTLDSETQQLESHMNSITEIKNLDFNSVKGKSVQSPDIYSQFFGDARNGDLSKDEFILSPLDSNYEENEGFDIQISNEDISA